MTADLRFGATPIQLEWRGVGSGCVELILRNAGPYPAFEKEHKFLGRDVVVIRLLYPQSGRMVGSRPVDEQNALELNQATDFLNVKLTELCS